MFETTNQVWFESIQIIQYTHLRLVKIHLLHGWNPLTHNPLAALPVYIPSF